MCLNASTFFLPNMDTVYKVGSPKAEVVRLRQDCSFEVEYKMHRECSVKEKKFLVEYKDKLIFN